MCFKMPGLGYNVETVFSPIEINLTIISSYNILISSDQKKQHQ